MKNIHIHNISWTMIHTRDDYKYLDFKLLNVQMSNSICNLDDI